MITIILECLSLLFLSLSSFFFFNQERYQNTAFGILMEGDQKLIHTIRDEYEAELRELENMIYLQQRKLDLMKQRRLLPNYEEMLRQAYRSMDEQEGEKTSKINPDIYGRIQNENTNDSTNLQRPPKGIDGATASTDEIYGTKERKESNFSVNETTFFPQSSLRKSINSSSGRNNSTDTYQLLEGQDKETLLQCSQTRSEIYDSWNDRRKLTFCEYLTNIFFPELQFQKREKVDPITYFHRLTVDLANERTWLAWIRTSMAIVRTLVIFIPLAGTNKQAEILLRTVSISFAILSVWMILQGQHRYRKIKELLQVENPPREFHRLSNFPIILTILFVVVVSNVLDILNFVEKR